MQYIITVYPQDYIEYYIEANSKEEAWAYYHHGNYITKEENFTGHDWQEPKIELIEDPIDTDN